ncbi:MAG: nodulation protein NfeD [Desulfurococcales archaeon]|nr:nodulation protein NfeD [Desulfurococcales archaeon]
MNGESKTLLIPLFLLLIILTQITISAAQEPPSTNTVYRENMKLVDKAVVIRVEGIIDDATLDYVKSAIRYAEEQNALLIIELNTPGGLLDSAMEIVIAIDKASIPVAGLVVDKWAESAGTLILVSTHIASMQPYTQIGSMQPIAYDPVSGSYEPVNDSKIINPILKFLDEHAASKGRNKTALHLFVTENLNLGPQEALKYNVIEYIATDANDLVRQVNGTTIELPSGWIVKISVPLDFTITRYQPGLRYYIAHTLSDPTLSGLLLSIGMLIIIFAILSGHLHSLGLGALLLLLGLLGSGYSISTTALILLLLGALLLGIEVFTPGFGIIGGTGIVMLVLGLILIPTSGEFGITQSYANTMLFIAYAVGIVLALIFAFIIYKVLRIRRKTRFEWKVVGKTGRASTDIEPGNEGFVVVDGEYWKATSKRLIKKGEKIVVIEQKGLFLVVDKAEDTE